MLLDGNRGKWEARAGAPVSFDVLTPSRQYSYIRAVRRNLCLRTIPAPKKGMWLLVWEAARLVQRLETKRFDHF